MAEKKTHSILDKEFTNLVHYMLCYLYVHVMGRRGKCCNCNRCPLQSCGYRNERRTAKTAKDNKGSRPTNI